MRGQGPDTGAEDAAALAAAARGDRSAFAGLIARHFPAAYRAAWRMTGGHADSEDLVQEAFLKLWANPGQLREPRALRGWLLRAVTNRAIDRARARSMAPLDAVPEPSAQSSGDGARGTVTNAVDLAVAALPDRQRQALVLVYFEEQSNIDAAAAMAISVDALESLLARARRGLKVLLAEARAELFDELGELE